MEFCELLAIVLERGDAGPKLLAGVSCQVVSSDAILAGVKDVYQAMLIRFCFSPHSDACVRANYTSTIAKLTTAGWHSMPALFNYRQSQAIGRLKHCCT